MIKRVPLVALALLAGCGGKGAQVPNPFEPVAGPRVDGDLFMLCGADPAQSLNLFSLKDGVLQRLTNLEGSGVNAYDVHGDTVALSYDGFPEYWGLLGDVTTLGSVPLQPGTRVGEAHNITVRDGRTVAFARRVEGRGGVINRAVYVKRLGSRAKRVATYRDVWDLKWVRGRLTARVSLPRSRPALVHDVGGPRQRTVRLEGDARYSIGPGAISADGRFAYTDVHVGDRSLIRFVSPAGKRQHTLATRWIPWAWSPDGKRLLVTLGGVPSKLGTMDPATGRVEELGPVACGFAADVVWR